MRLEFTKPFIPLMDTQIELSISNGIRRETIKLNAHVSRGNPYANNIGGAYMAEVYSVSFPINSISSDISITRGGLIRVSDAIKTQLTIQNAYTLNGLYILECTTKERTGL